MPPSIWPLAVTGLTITPLSTAITISLTVICPVSRVDRDRDKLRGKRRRRRIRADIAGGRHDLMLILSVQAVERDLTVGHTAPVRRIGRAIAQHDVIRRDCGRGPRPC